MPASLRLSQEQNITDTEVTVDLSTFYNVTYVRKSQLVFKNKIIIQAYIP